MVDVTCCIVLYNNKPEIVKDAISSFLNTNLKVKLFLIDSSPTDFLKILCDDLRVEYFHNSQNMGFGAAHNIAIKKALNFKSRYHLVLNPDVYFDSGTLENIYSFMNKNVEAGLLMPKVLFPDGTFQFLCKRNPTLFDLFIRGFLPTFLKKKFKRRINRYEYRDFDFEKTIWEVPYLSGCFMFFRSEVLQKIGDFDEKIFMYLEDADITRRVLEVSNTVYFPEAFIFHHYAGLTHKKLKYKLITIRSALIYFNKWGWWKSIF